MSLSDIFSLESLKDYIGEIRFFKELRSMVEIQPQYRSISIRNTNNATSGDGLSARPATLPWTPFKFKSAQNPHLEIVVPPLLEKCKAFSPLVDSHRYLVAKQQALCEVKSISQSLSVGLLQYIYTAILDASEDETHGVDSRNGSHLLSTSTDTTYVGLVDMRSTLHEIKALQTKLDATDDEDEQRALEEDVTGRILWFTWCGILSEAKQRLSEVVDCIRRERNATTPERRDRLRQGLHVIGDIIKKASRVQLDDDLAHLRRIMLDAVAGVSKHRLWAAARVAEQDKWSSASAWKKPPCYSSNLCRAHPHIPCSVNSGH
ncbi:hypothetical protein EDC04DRAFT_440870 [Pisolithus marmoratus]|nr:hypothetical protein EDC04DRAFT_440870 [Pisolithus marmoratus]